MRGCFRARSIAVHGRLLLASAAVLTDGAATGVLAQGAAELPPILVQGATAEVIEPRKDAGEEADRARAAPAPAEGSTAPAEGTPAPGGESIGGIPIDRIGSSVSVVTGAELEERQIRNAADALRSLPGVSVSRQGNPHNLTVVRLRGAESNHTLVLIDGVEVNSGTTDGFFDFANLGTEDIEQIEVLRGPQSGLYGGSAVGGVINIITKQGKGPLTVRARTEAGAFGTEDGLLQVSGGDDRAHGILSLYGRRTDGFNISLTGNEEDFGRFSSFNFTGGVRPFEHLKIDGTLRRSHVEGGRDNGFGGVLDGFAVPADDGSTFGNTMWIGRLAATLDTLDGHLVHQFRVTRAQMDTTDHDATFGTDLATTGIHTKYGYVATYRLDGPTGLPVRHFLTGLVEREEESFVQPVGGDGIERERGRTGYVGEVRGEYFNSLFLTATIRRDDNDVFEDFSTWRTSASWKVPQTPFRVHASYGTAVKYPSFSEQFGFFVGFFPNPNLQPEDSQGWDAGIETRFLGGRAVVDVTYFNQNLHNEIDFRAATDPAAPPFSFEPFNRAGTSTREGVEVAARYLLAPGLTLGGSYTFLDAKEDTGQEEVRRPRHSGRLDVNYAFDGGRGNFNVAAIYNGDMKDLAFEAGPPFGSQVVLLKEYWLVSAAASYRVAPGVELFGRVENALDEDYQEVFGFATAGIAAFAGVRFTYEEPATAAAARYR